MTLAVLWFIIFCLFRYIRLFVNAAAFWTYWPRPRPASPRYTSKDVTVNLPTVFDKPDVLAKTVASILANNVSVVNLIIKESDVPAAERLIREHGFTDVSTVGVPFLNKRHQTVAGLKKVETELMISADDDVVWPRGYLDIVIPPYEDSKVGGTGTGMRGIRKEPCTAVNIINIAYLERRNFNTGATNRIDGAISTLSGRSASYRTRALQTEEFYNAFLGDTSHGELVMAGDDKFITTWLFSHDWKIVLSFDGDRVLHTHCADDWPTLHKQLERYARSHWRGKLQALGEFVMGSFPLLKYPWTLYSFYIGTCMTPAILIDGLLMYSLFAALRSLQMSSGAIFFTMLEFALFILFTKTVKMFGHFRRHPADLMWVPMLIGFSYFHGWINLCALWTRNKTGWDSKKIA